MMLRLVLMTVVRVVLKAVNVESADCAAADIYTRRRMVRGTTLKLD